MKFYIVTTFAASVADTHRCRDYMYADTPEDAVRESLVGTVDWVSVDGDKFTAVVAPKGAGAFCSVRGAVEEIPDDLRCFVRDSASFESLDAIYTLLQLSRKLSSNDTTLTEVVTVVGDTALHGTKTTKEMYSQIAGALLALVPRIEGQHPSLSDP